MGEILRRNNKELPLKRNGSTRHGQFPWHNEDCQIEDHGMLTYDGSPIRALWCATHGQWADEGPISVTYKFEDGTEITKVMKKV